MPPPAISPAPRSARIKRFLDLALVLLTSPLWFPLLLAVAVLVRVRLGSPIFFTQPRAGRYGAVFDLVKFRSMSGHRGPDGLLLPDHARLTPFGKWLRSTSLDELPELFLVLRGHMSLVGPRPLMVDYLPRYNPRQARRHEVLPGLTGWAQVNGRNAISWPERLEMDVWYVENQSLTLDLKILLLTLRSVFHRQGIHAPGHDTMPEFSESTPVTDPQAPAS